MSKKIQLTQPGYYQFQLSATKDQHIIHSVFEYQQVRDILACLDHSELVAYTLLEDQIHWIMKCETDWQSIIEQLNERINALHKHIWQNHKVQISAKVKATYIEAPKNLVPCVMHLHHLPVKLALVATADMYEFSSDKFYRMEHPPHWLHAEVVLSRLSHQRFHRALRYERICEVFDYHQPVECHEQYDAFASDQHMQQLFAEKAKQADQISWEQALLVCQQAQQLVSKRLGMHHQETLPLRHNRQQVHQQQQLDSLVAFLLAQRSFSIEMISHLLQSEELIVQTWLRSVEAQHPQSFIERLLVSWQPQKMTKPEDGSASIEGIDEIDEQQDQQSA